MAACYLYAGATDVAALTGDTALLDLLKTKWEKLAGRKMYVTGGTGHPSYHEGFAPDYDLPNEKAYCETCASLAVIFWSHRLFLATGDARYIDVAERALYNGFLAGVSLSGDKFFYVNPLASRGNHHRQPWHGCTCCPTNVVRFFPTLGQYVYASTDNTVYVNLYAAGSGKVKLGSRAVTVSQETTVSVGRHRETLGQPDRAARVRRGGPHPRLVPRGMRRPAGCIGRAGRLPSQR